MGKEISYLRNFCGTIFWYIKECYDKKVQEYLNEGNEITEEYKQALLSKIIEVHLEEVTNSRTVFKEYIDDGFLEENRAVVLEGIDYIFNKHIVSDEQKSRLFSIVKIDIQKLETDNLYSKYSGILMAGYGDSEIYPSICNVKLFGKLGKNLLHEEMKILKIEENGESIIYPVAQTDVINTFINGIDPTFEQMWKAKLEEFSQSALNLVAKKNKKTIQDLYQKIKLELKEYLQENYRGPIFKIVASLPRTNLTEMAEALINITSLRRHVSTDSESVGGPTDVAIISKTDGFIWVKRKNHFNQKKYSA